MKKIEAIIRPSKITAVKEALEAIPILGMTVLDATGFGRQEGYTEIYRGSDLKVEFLSKAKIEIVLEEKLVDICVKVISDAARTGAIGDGKIMVSTIDHVYRIRTGEADIEAI